MVGVRYRLHVTKEIVVPKRLCHLFDNREIVKVRDYEVVVDSHQMGKEREVQEVVKMFPKDITLTTVKHIME